VAYSGNFERGEIVSPEDALPARDRVLDVATPDARHRRPLKFSYGDCGTKFRLLGVIRRKRESQISLGWQLAKDSSCSARRIGMLWGGGGPAYSESLIQVP